MAGWTMDLICEETGGLGRSYMMDIACITIDLGGTSLSLKITLFLTNQVPQLESRGSKMISLVFLFAIHLCQMLLTFGLFHLQYCPSLDAKKG